MNIEPLESRIAPAALVALDKLSARYTDVDGDLVTIRFTKPIADLVGYQFNLPPGPLGETLTGLDLTPLVGKGVDGLGVAITARPQPMGALVFGDGHANVGFFNALNLDLGAVSVAGDVQKIRAGSGAPVALKSFTAASLALVASGAPNPYSIIVGGVGALKIRGDVHGGFSATTIGTTKVGGSLIGDLGNDTGKIEGTASLGVVKIAGSVAGFNGMNSGAINSGGKIGAVSIGQSLRGGAGSGSGSISATGDAASLRIGGDVVGATGDSSGGILALGTIRQLSIRGSVSGGDDFSDDHVNQAHFSGQLSAAALGTVQIGGSIVGGNAPLSGRIAVNGAIGSITLGGSLRGGATTGVNPPNFTGEIRAGGAIGPVKIGGDLRGSDGFAGGATSETGTIRAQKIASVSVVGSIVSGIGSVDLSGALVATETLGSITVKGSLEGAGGNHVSIFAQGLAAATAHAAPAIKSVSVAGRVEHAWIFAGVDLNVTAVPGTNATIGAVRVGGDWILSDVESGATSTDGKFGDSNDALLAGSISKIASITIGGQVTGTPAAGERYGFLAHEIGAFHLGGVTVALKAGAGNDRFADGRAHPLGSSLSTGNPDGFAMHVFEI